MNLLYHLNATASTVVDLVISTLAMSFGTFLLQKELKFVAMYQSQDNAIYISGKLSKVQSNHNAGRITIFNLQLIYESILSEHVHTEP